MIDDKLMNLFLKAAGLKANKEVVEEELRVLIKDQSKLKPLRGKFHWEGNIDKMRKDK